MEYMPAKRRRPVIEEIVEEKEAPAAHTHEHKGHSSHASARKRVAVEEEPQEEVKTEVRETVQEVASYDEPVEVPAQEEISTPPPLTPEAPASVDPEEAARRLLSAEDARPARANVKLLFFVTILTALIVGFVAGGVYVYVTGVTNSGSTPEATPTPIETSTPAPTSSATPKPTVALSTYSVNVLNGSGIIGAAGVLRDALESAGFKVSGTGNAANYNFTNTVIQVKESVDPAALAAAKEALKDYVVEEGDTLPASSKFDIIVTSGKK